MKGNSFSNGPGAGNSNSGPGSQGPCAVNPYTGTPLQPQNFLTMMGQV